MKELKFYELSYYVRGYYNDEKRMARFEDKETAIASARAGYDDGISFKLIEVVWMMDGAITESRQEIAKVKCPADDEHIAYLKERIESAQDNIAKLNANKRMKPANRDKEIALWLKSIDRLNSDIADINNKI